MKQNDQRYSKHKFDVLGFVSDAVHSHKHCDRTAKGGKEKQSAFGRSILGFFICCPFVISGNGNAYYRNDQQISKREEQKDLVIKNKLDITSWGKSL